MYVCFCLSECVFMCACVCVYVCAASWRPELGFLKEIYVFFEFLGALPVCLFLCFFGRKIGQWCDV